jgi:hypothetical protein
MAERLSRAEMKRAYKETPKQAGIFRIKNLTSGDILLGSSTNLHGPLNKHRFLLTIGKHDNQALQRDWNRLGADSFAFEIIEVVKTTDDPTFDLGDELALLEQIWLEKLRPLGQPAYNVGPIRRD